ncbi:MAG: hypothetical protein EBQ92_07385 [Proteobacteria bacterium]|nr:hypothetical protein [Pseudomonadota bacterium]
MVTNRTQRNLIVADPWIIWDFVKSPDNSMVKSLKGALLAKSTSELKRLAIFLNDFNKMPFI